MSEYRKSQKKGKNLSKEIDKYLTLGISPEHALSDLSSQCLKDLCGFFDITVPNTKSGQYERLVHYYRTGE